MRECDGLTDALLYVIQSALGAARSIARFVVFAQMKHLREQRSHGDKTMANKGWRVNATLSTFTWKSVLTFNPSLELDT